MAKEFYRARIVATLSYFWIDKTYKDTLDIIITSDRLEKKPTQAFFKSYLRLCAANYGDWIMDESFDFRMGMKIQGCSPLRSTSIKYYEARDFENVKFTNISFISIKVHKFD